MQSKNSNYQFKTFSKSQISVYQSARQGEKRVGASIFSIQESSEAKFILLGISESIGPLANGGQKGAENAFESFLPFFLNTQDFKHDAACIGIIQWIGTYTEDSILTDYVNELDEFVLNVLTKYVRQNQIPVVIGGGHNNALPLIRWANLSQKKIEVLNLDAHADCRAIEGRHSGNSFSYAIKEGQLHKYHVFGLHRPYLNDVSHQFLLDHCANFTFYEDYLDGTQSLDDDIKHLISSHPAASSLGIDIDMDCIADMPSSAISPSGWRFDEVRSALRKLAQSKLPISYLHLTEAAPMTEVEQKKAGKALAYLVRDFIENINDIKG
jgi:formiminoglutamase